MKTKRTTAKTKADGIDALSKAKGKYKARGDASSCGDWLAEARKASFHASDAFDIDGFARCLKENGIDWTLGNKDRPGWIGRFRMN